MKEDYLQRWIGGWFDIVDGLIAVITLGIISPHFCFDYLCWNMKRKNKKYLAEQNKKNG